MTSDFDRSPTENVVLSKNDWYTVYLQVCWLYHISIIILLRVLINTLLPNELPIKNCLLKFVPIQKKIDTVVEFDSNNLHNA